MKSVLKLLCIFLSMLMLASCGKALNIIDDDEDVPGGGKDPVSPGGLTREVIKEQTVACPDEIFCFESVAKMVLFNKNSSKPDFCTGSLVKSNVVMLPATCLPRHLRIPGADCSKDVYAIFPELRGFKERKVACTKIISADFLEGNEDPSTVVSDLAFVMISEHLDRPPFEISEDGLEDGEEYEVWKVNKIDTNEAVIRKERCSPTYKTYAQPMGVSAKSPNVILTDCHYEKTNKGSVVLDRFGRVLAIVTSTLNTRIKNYFLNSGLLENDAARDIEEKLAPMVYTTNLACLKSNRVVTRKTPFEKDCLIDLSEKEIKKRRMNMKQSREIHESFIARFSNLLINDKSANKWVLWQPNLVPVAGKPNSFRTTLTPKCFNNYLDWTRKFKNKRSYEDTFKLYSAISEMKFDRKLRVFAQVPKNSEREARYMIRFRPRNVKNDGHSTLHLNDFLVSSYLRPCLNN